MPQCDDVELVHHRQISFAELTHVWQALASQPCESQERTQVRRKGGAAQRSLKVFVGVGFGEHNILLTLRHGPEVALQLTLLLRRCLPHYLLRR